MAAEINEDDLISDGALNIVAELTKEFVQSEEELDELIQTILRHKQVTDEQADSVKGLLKRVDSLEKEQKKLNDINKKLEDQLKRTNKKVKEQGDAMEALDNRVGGAITRYKQLGKEMLALAKSPFILTLAVIIGLVAALTSSVKAFFTSTGEGEDILDRQQAVWKQFFNVLRNGWASLGKAVSDFFGEGGSTALINSFFEVAKVRFPFLIGELTAMQMEFNRTAAAAVDLANKNDALADRMIENSIKEAKTRKAVNELILKSIDELNFTEQERLNFLQQAIDKQEAQMLSNVNLAKQTSANLLTEIGLRHSLDEAQVRRLTQEQRYALFTEEENKAIADSIVKIIDLEGNYLQEIKKNSAKIVAFKQAIHKKEITDAEQVVKDKVTLLKRQMEEEIFIVTSSLAQGQILRVEADKKIEVIRHNFAKRMAVEEEEGLMNLVKSLNLTAEEQEKFIEKIYALRAEVTGLFYEQLLDDQARAEKAIAKIQKIYDLFVQSIGSLFTTFSENKLADIDREEARLEEFYDKQIEMAGDNEERKKELENEAEKRRAVIERKRIKEMRRAAIFEKILDGIQAAINTAVAVTSLLEFPPLAFAAGIAGAAQVAAIAAKQIPQYEFGTGNHPGGLAIVGDGPGSELIHDRGRTFLSPDQPTLMNLGAGAQVLSHEDSMRALALAGMNVGGSMSSNPNSEVMNFIGAAFNSLSSAVKNKKEVHINVTPQGVELYLKTAEGRRQLLDKLFS